MNNRDFKIAAILSLLLIMILIVTFFVERFGKKQENYTETGIASYYAEEWHGKKTASGEIYDMYGLTAAHKTLPFGTIVRIRDLETGKRTWARINNRGPFVEGRIIDLSRGAARELGITDKGIAKVRITVIKWPDED